MTEIGDDAFHGCSSLVFMTFPKNLLVINRWTFAGCSSLTLAEITDGVIGIGDCAFRDCANLQSLVMPKSMRTVGRMAFRDCPKLKYISVDAENPPALQENTFVKCEATVYVPKAKLAAYRGAKHWTAFKNVKGN